MAVQSKVREGKTVGESQATGLRKSKCLGMGGASEVVSYKVRRVAPVSAF
jgi:hypothetical protein